MQEFLRNLGAAAAAAGFLITISSLFAACINGFQRALRLPADVRAYFFRPKFILVPTVDELAKYCVKEPEHYRPTEEEELESRKGAITKKLRQYRDQAKARVVLLLISFSLCYLVLLARLLQYGFK